VGFGLTDLAYSRNLAYVGLQLARLLKLIAISHLGCVIERFGDANGFQHMVRKGGTKFRRNLHYGYLASEAL
jgi:hypothetical protein